MFHRVSRAVFFGWVPLLLAMPAMSASADKPKDVPDLKEMDVYQLGNVVEKDTIYLAAGGGGMNEHKHNYQLAVKAVSDGKVQNVVVIEEKGGSIGKILADAKPGDYLTLSLQKQFNHVYVTSLVPYGLRPGENLPNIYVFVETSASTEGKTETTAVKVYKLGKFATLAIPSVRDKDSGKLVADPEMIRETGQFSKGDSVEVALRGGSAPAIKTINAYAAPRAAVFAKLTDADVEGGKTPAIEVAIDGADTTILVPGKKDSKGKWISDAALASAVKRFKKDDNVTVRFFGDEGKNWLKEISKASKPKPADKSTATP